MKLAGVVLDFYDDSEKSLLKTAFPKAEDLPEVIKIAHILSPEEQGVLRDSAYALVMINEGEIMRKFACVDAGNTLLSILYFDANKDKLPEEAVKVAGTRLAQFAADFGFHEKTAGAMMRRRDSGGQPIPSDDGDWAQRTNLLSVRGGSDSGKVYSTANNMKVAAVDVTDKSPAPKFKQASANRTALNGRYALDSFADVQRAIAYFEESYANFTPEDRHTYCVKTASRATELGIETTPLIERYGSTAYAPDVEAHIINRKALSDSAYHPIYDEILEKQAQMSPEEFVICLDAADEASGVKWYWGGEAADPYYATYGGLDLEKEKMASWSWMGRVGDYVTAYQLKHLAQEGRGLVHKMFASDIVEAFQKDPIAIFESLPDDKKTLLARMANSVDSDPGFNN